MVFVSLVATCVKLAAYLACIGIALELSHRLYWSINNWVLSMETHPARQSVLSTLVACIPLASALSVTFLFTFLLDNQSLASLGLHYDSAALGKVANGAAVATLCVMLMFLLGIVMGYIQVRRARLSEDRVACLPLVLGGFIDFFTGAVFEEVIFRGYVYYVLFRYGGDNVAIVVSSLVFSLAHLIKHSHTPRLFAVNALIFGLLAATCRCYTHSLWLPIGLHFGWNVMSGPILGLPYSGRRYENGVVESRVSGPEWLTGGLYSLDAGVLGTVALAAAAAGLSTLLPIR